MRNFFATILKNRCEDQTVRFGKQSLFVRRNVGHKFIFSLQKDTRGDICPLSFLILQITKNYQISDSYVFSLVREM